MRKVLIGSQAIRKRLGVSQFYRSTEKSDYDYLVDLSPEEFKQLKKGNIGQSGKNLREEMYNVRGFPGLTALFIRNDDVISLEDLYTLKFSHVFWNIHWRKTIADIEFFQRLQIPCNDTILSYLYRDWEKIHGKKQGYLNVSNKEFFCDGVSRLYIHDDIHRAIKYYNEPLYERCKYDKTKANLNYDLFCDLSRIDKLRLCREEIYVTALERFLIPCDFKMSAITAYIGACRLLITSMTKGWFPHFIVENWLQLNKQEINYITRFKENISLCQPQV